MTRLRSISTAEPTSRCWPGTAGSTASPAAAGAARAAGDESSAIATAPAAHDAAVGPGDPAFLALTAGCLERCRLVRLRALNRKADVEGLSEELLHGLADIGVEDLPGRLVTALSEQGPGTATVLEMISENPSQVSEAADLFRDVCPEDRYYLGPACADDLVRHGHGVHRVIRLPG